MKHLIIGIFAILSVFSARAQEKPSVIWIVCEDVSPYLGSYGDPIIRTPNIDQLSSESIRYTRVYTAAGVCAPSRAAIITGMYPISVGAQHMRTLGVSEQYTPEGIPARYSVVLPEKVKAFPEYLRKEGYYTSNNHKEDYQFEEPVTVWDESSPAASYRNRAANQPFFSVFNFARTHESQMMVQQDSLGYNPTDMIVPQYFEDTEITRKDLALLYTRIEEMDQGVGELIAQLKEDGVYDNSYVFFYSDHGGMMPWTKRAILERGTHIPFMVKLPKGAHRGTVNNDLINSVDFAPTVLSISGIKPPEYTQGTAFLGKHKSTIKNKYVYAASDRFDTKYDRVRSISDGSFRYVYNFEPEKPKYMDIEYRKGIRTMSEILEHKAAGSITNPYLLDWFNKTKPQEELYYTLKDSDEVINLANDSRYNSKKEELKKALFEWIDTVGDLSITSEKEMIANWWNHKPTAPKTEKATIKIKNGFATLSCATEGASIGYRIQNNSVPDSIIRQAKSWDFYNLFGNHKTNDIKVPLPYKVYTGEPIALKKGERIIVNTHRIGYEPTEVVKKY